MKNSAPALILSVFSLLLLACVQDPVSVSGGGEMEIRLHVTGGFAGADYVVFLDGASRSLVGESCSTFCGFAEGEVLQSLTPEQVDYIWTLFQEAVVSGHTLQIRLSYGGGCRVHDVKAVAWGGWMESNPVQVRLFLSHEDFDDPCDAWITRDIGLDLVPLKIAYQVSYGVSEPGKTTLILLLADQMLASPQGVRWLEYRF